ncbi:MAG: PrsW family intramembrane metalloprotease [Lachnospiraceae bacterium]|nr:PrsW family intramembrane metalloprotease [Lachnospiraceae bacterium]
MLYLAIIPSIILFIIVWRSDKIEKEPVGLLLKVFIFGALTTISAIVIGLFTKNIVTDLIDEESLIFIFIDNFFLTALVEEGGKYFVLKKTTWKHPAFNYMFDGVVYAVCSSLGFATVENILYLFDEGIGTAIGRGLLSVPGHVTYAIFMGYYYGMAKLASVEGDTQKVRSSLIKALWIPVLLHGTYDFCLSSGYDILIVVFFIFEVVLSVVAFKKLRKLSKEDRPIS